MINRKRQKLKAADLCWESQHPSATFQGVFAWHGIIWLGNELSQSLCTQHLHLPQDTQTFSWTLRMGREFSNLKTWRPVRPRAMFYVSVHTVLGWWWAHNGCYHCFLHKSIDKWHSRRSLVLWKEAGLWNGAERSETGPIWLCLCPSVPTQDPQSVLERRSCILSSSLQVSPGCDYF